MPVPMPPSVPVQALDVDHPQYDTFLRHAELIVADYNKFGHIIMNEDFTMKILFAYATWKKIAEERQEHLEWWHKTNEIPTVDKSWKHQCGFLNEGHVLFPMFCGGCRFEITEDRKDEIEAVYVMLKEG